MYIETKLDIPLGITIHETKKDIGIKAAADIIASKSRTKYSYAIRREDSAALIKHVAICGHCKSAFPAYHVNLPDDESSILTHGPAFTNEVVREWKDEQLSLFEPIFKTVKLNVPLSRGQQRICPKCFFEQTVTSSIRHVIITESKYKFCISCQILNMSELVNELRSFAPPDIHFNAFPMTESLEFNIRKGRAVYKIKGKDDNVLFIRDITEDYYPLNGGVMQDLVSRNKDVSKRVRRFFRSFWTENAFPFNNCECDIYTLIQMTRFVGYPASFYSYIPYCSGTSKLIAGKRKSVSLLHWANNAEAVYNASGLPAYKSIRKEFFSNPGLLFYADEAAALWKVINNCDLFRMIASSSEAAIIFGNIHVFPRLLEFYSAYSSAHSEAALCIALTARLQMFNRCGIYYCSLNDYLRASEIKSIKNVVDSLCSCYDDADDENNALLQGDSAYVFFADFSYPMHSISSPVYSCYVNGYKFLWLHSKNDYMRCGNALHNCLTRWSPDQNPVIAIFDGDKCVGAAEIEGDRIVQAFTIRNNHIQSDKKLYGAFLRWVKIQKLYYCDYDDDDYDDD